MASKSRPKRTRTDNKRYATVEEMALLWLEDISYEEIGAIVGITAKNVSVRLYRIRQQLKSMSENND
jgi:DNA-directed RNA polymerase specialized sigma24 family protein